MRLTYDCKIEEKDILKNSLRDSDILSRFTHLYQKDLQTPYINFYRAKEVLNQAEFIFKKLKKIKNITKRNSNLNQDMLAVLLLFAYPDRLARRRSKNDR